VKLLGEEWNGVTLLVLTLILGQTRFVADWVLIQMELLFFRNRFSFVPLFE